MKSSDKVKFDDKMQNLYANLSNGGTMTRGELINCGFSSTEISNFTKKGIFIRDEAKRGVYYLGDVNGLYEYSNTCIKKGEVLRALNCILKCVEYDPTHIEANFQLFVSAVESKNFKKSISYMDNIYSNPDVSAERYDFLVFLLSKISELPANLKKHAVLYKPRSMDSKGATDPLREVIDLAFKDKFKDAASTLVAVPDSVKNKGIVRILLEEIIRLENSKTSSRNIIATSSKKNTMPFGHTVDDVFVRLSERDYESAFGTVHNYLKSIGRLEYEELAISMITVNILEKDTIYYEPIKFLTGLAKEEFSFDVSPYLDYFEETLSERKISLAEAVLGVIKNSHMVEEAEIRELESRIPKRGVDTTKLKYDTNSINIDEFYGVEGIQIMIWAMETGIALDDVFKRFDATDEQRALVYLILAKEAYVESDFAAGDRYMRMVEKLKKTKQIKEIIKYLTTNKKFLRNREKRNIPYVILPK